LPVRPERDAATLENNGLCVAGGKTAGGAVGRAAGGIGGRAAGGIDGGVAGGTAGRAVGGIAGRAAGGAVGRAAAGGATRPGAGPPRKPGDERRAALGCGARCAGERVASRPFRFGDSVKRNARSGHIISLPNVGRKYVLRSSRRARRLGESNAPGDQAALLPSGC